MPHEEQQLGFDLVGLTPEASLPGEHGRGHNGSANKLDVEDRPFHDWYRFVLSFPPHLVRTYLSDFGLDERHTVLDPFCGTGTTVVECKLNRVRGVGLEANPFAHFASTVKLDWNVDPDALEFMAQRVDALTWQALEQQGIRDNEPFSGSVNDLSLRSLDADAMALLLKGSISPLPLHKSLVLLEHLLPYQEEPHYRHAALALAYVVGDQASFLRVMIRTGHLIADIAQALGYDVVRIDLFRTRLATATREQLREEVVVLRWRGDAG